MYKVQDLYDQHGQELDLELIVGGNGMKRVIQAPETYRPGLALAGFLENHASKRILIFGKIEIEFLDQMKPALRAERLKGLLSFKETPAVIVARNFRPPHELKEACKEQKMPLFRSSLTTMNLISRLTVLLTEDFALSKTVHGTLVEVFGVGVLIQGDSSVGKSEAALGLIERGHRLISDDTVKIKKREGNTLDGSGSDLTKHLMEIRGIGIINVAHLYGAVCVRNSKNIDLVVKLENWDEENFYDRVGLEEKTCEILDVKLPFHVLPVKPGRDVVLLLETIALNHRLKDMGYNSAREFKNKILELTAGRR